VDLRDLARPESGLTLRRLSVLVNGLPFDSQTWRIRVQQYEQAQKATPDRIRSRQAEWKRRNEAARAKEAANG
jgi:hypothetical protein